MPLCADIQVEPCRSNDRKAGIMATGTPPAGEPYGISTATTDALNTKFTACENVIGAPASALHTALLPHTTGTDPDGEDYGIDADATENLKNLPDAYEAVIGAPAP
jgi:hypothetical protein